MSESLSQADVQKLLADPSPEVRVQLISKVGAQFRNPGIAMTERRLMEDIFRVMVRDVEVKVRAALAVCLKENPAVPQEIARALAHDVAEVALPIVEFSEVLSEDTLMEIIREQGGEHQKAIARRGHVSETISDALISTSNPDVVAALMANDGAVISEKSMGRVLDEFGTLSMVVEPLALRKALPLTTAERLVTLVSERMREHLVHQHKLSKDTITDLFLGARERATLGLLAPDTNLGDMMELVEQLHENNRLTPTLIFRALCTGDVAFFEAALARLANIPVPNAYKLIHDPGGRGLEALFQKLGLPHPMLNISKAALGVIEEVRMSGGDDKDQMQRIIIERVLTKFENGFDTENLDYFIARLGSKV